MTLVDTLFQNFSDVFSFWQLIGWVSVVFYVLSYQFLEPRKTMFMIGVSALILLPHLYGIEAPYTTMVVLFFGAFRNFITAFASKKWVKIVVIINLFLAWGISFWIAQNIIDYLPTVAMSCMSFAALFRDKFYTYRIWAITSNILWIFNYIILGSYAGLSLAILTASSNIVGVVRYRLKNSNRA